MNQRDETAGSEHERVRESNGGREHWHGYRSRPGRDHDELSGARFRPVTEEWEAARGYGGGANELGYGGGQGRHEGQPASEGHYGGDRSHEGRYGSERYGGDRYHDEGRSGWGVGASQPYYGPRAYWRDRASWQDLYGFGQRNQRHEQPFDREPFGRREDPPYYGTGAPGWGGPGFTGGAYAYGYGPRYPRRSPLEGEYSDESAVSYEQQPRRGYDDRSAYGARHPQGHSGGGGTRYRQYPPGPKGYQRSDERLKEDISERLMESHNIDSSEVTVEVRGAKVILEGTVPSRFMKHAIEDLVAGCAGVGDIDNRVRVESPNYQGSIAPTSSSSNPNGAKSN